MPILAQSRIKSEKQQAISQNEVDTEAIESQMQKLHAIMDKQLKTERAYNFLA